VPIVRALGQPGLALVVESAGRRSAATYWELVERCERFRDRFAASLKASGIDAILCPPHPLPAISHGASYGLGLGGTYSLASNLLGMPAGVVSTTRVRRGEESERARMRDRSSSTAVACERGSAGLPVGVQITGWHGQDDVVLALMRELEEHFAGTSQFPLKDRPSDNNKEVQSEASDGLA
jgi:fatty acid amide hydrolase